MYYYISEIYPEMSDILQFIKYLKVKLHKSQGIYNWQFSYLWG